MLENSRTLYKYENIDNTILRKFEITEVNTSFIYNDLEKFNLI